MSELFFYTEKKIYESYCIHPNGKRYKHKDKHTLSLPRVEQYFNSNQDQYSIFKNKLPSLKSIQEKAKYLESITNLSFSCCRKYVVTNNL